MKLTQSQLQWAKIYMPSIIMLTGKTNLFPEVVLSQALLESSRGGIMPGSTLAKVYFNLFGMKATGATPSYQIVNLKTKEFVKGEEVTTYQKFKRYNNPLDSITDYINLITKSPRYANALKATTAEEQIKLIAAAGYATSPSYSKAVTGILRAYINSIPNANVNPELLILNRLISLIGFAGVFFF